MPAIVKRVKMIALTLLGAALAACGSLASAGDPTHRFVIELDAHEEGGELSEEVVAATITSLSRRLEAFDIAAHSIEQSGKDRIVLELSGLNDRSELEPFLGNTTKFELRMVDDRAELLDVAAGNAPLGSEILPMADGSGNVAVRKLGKIDGKHLTDAMPSIDQYTDELVVNLKFDEQGAKKLAQLTSDNVGKAMAMVIDGEVMSTPIINEPVVGGEIQLAGGFSHESANELAIRLHAGALPAKAEIIEERLLD